MPGEPLWLDDDTEAALAWQAEQDALCPGCHHPIDETTGDDDDFFAEAIVCNACRASGLASKDWSEAEGGPGAMFPVRRVRPPTL